jgi:uncharacterized protein (TIGR00369 family)
MARMLDQIQWVDGGFAPGVKPFILWCATLTKMLDLSRAVARGEAPPPAIAKLIGFDLVSVDPGEAVVEFQATEAHANPMGTLHGGVLCDIADAAMGIAYSSNLRDGESFTTLELKINFLTPIWKARLLAIGRVVKQGREREPRRPRY